MRTEKGKEGKERNRGNGEELEEMGDVAREKVQKVMSSLLETGVRAPIRWRRLRLCC